MPGRWALAIRGPLTCFEGSLLAQCYYKFALYQGMSQLSMTLDANTLVHHVLEIMEMTAKDHDTQFKPAEQGSLNTFGAIARDYDGNFAVAHKKHPHSHENPDIAESVGHFSSQLGCFSIAANSSLAQESVDKLSLAQTLLPMQLCQHVQNEANNRKLIGGLSIDQYGNIEVAVGSNVAMGWIVGSYKGFSDIGFNPGTCRQFPNTDC